MQIVMSDRRVMIPATAEFNPSLLSGGLKRNARRALSEGEWGAWQHDCAAAVSSVVVPWWGSQWSWPSAVRVENDDRLFWGGGSWHTSTKPGLVPFVLRKPSPVSLWARLEVVGPTSILDGDESGMRRLVMARATLVASPEEPVMKLPWQGTRGRPSSRQPGGDEIRRRTAYWRQHAVPVASVTHQYVRQGTQTAAPPAWYVD